MFAAGGCKLFEKQKDETAPLMISDTAIALFEEAPDKNAVVEKFIFRFQPSSWSGSLADILEVRLPLLDQLIVTGNEAVSSAIASAKAKLQNRIDTERSHEAEEEKSRNSSFE
jgi:hypothetical protein